MKKQNGKGIHRNKESIISITLILSDIIRHLKGSRVYKPTVEHKKSQKPKM